MTRTQTLLFASMLAIVVVSCQPGESATQAPPTAESPAAEPAAAETPAEDATPPDATTPAGEVTYEPAYPADVSSEGLSEEDTAQQEGSEHSHGGATHTHGEDESQADDEHEH